MLLYRKAFASTTDTIQYTPKIKKMYNGEVIVYSKSSNTVCRTTLHPNQMTVVPYIQNALPSRTKPGIKHASVHRLMSGDREHF